MMHHDHYLTYTVRTKDEAFIHDIDGIYATRVLAVQRILQMEYLGTACIKTIIKLCWVLIRACIYTCIIHYYVLNSTWSNLSCTPMSW